MVVTLGQQYNVGEKPTVILYTYINYHAQPPMMTQHNHCIVHSYEDSDNVDNSLKKNQSAPRPSEHAPVMGGKMSKRLGGIKGCKYKTSSWHLNRFPDADNIVSTV